MFTVTREWIHQHKTPPGGWTRAQLEVLGIAWPPKKGWLSGMIGKQIPDIDRIRFEEVSRHANH